MKKLSMVLASIIMLLAVNVMAQGREGNPEDRSKKQLDHLKVMLDLTDEQLTTVKGIMENSQEEMKALRDDAEKEREAKREDMKVIKTVEQEEIKTILSADQKIKFEEMIKMNEGKEKERRGGGKGKPKRGGH